MPKENAYDKLNNIRHSLAHILAAAVLHKFPDAKLGIGPTIENGFYYDFLLPRTLAPDDLKEFEKTIRHLINKNLPMSGKKVTPAEAKKLFKAQPFKLDLIKEFVKEKKDLTVYEILEPQSSQLKATIGSEKEINRKNLFPSSEPIDEENLHQSLFTDLCKGGHVKNTKEISADAFTLEKIAGAYWRGDEKNPQLQRIYGLAFNTKKELDEFLKMQEEAKKRDHKKLGRELELFMFHETAPGMPYWLPKGTILYNELIQFWREEHARRGYQETISPILNKKELYVISGHFEHYWEEMFVAKTPDGEEYGAKAMNCPNAMVIFGSKSRSYRDLPLRLSDTDTLHRLERSGVLNGLFRVREFRQDDAHIFISEDMIETEYEEILKIVERFYSVFGLTYSFRLGTRPKKFLGDAKTWKKAEATLEKILKNSGKEFAILEGDGAFYGPKIDIIMKDALRREWQMGTIQLDFQQPMRFHLEYAAADGSKKTPVAIHRVIYGSMERFIGIFIEHYAGAFPLWLAPVQVAVLPVSEKFADYGAKVLERIRENNIRVHMSDTNETLGKRIREAEMQKIPYVLVVGEKEEKNRTVNVRHYRRGQEGEIAAEKLVSKIKEEVEKKVI